MGLDIYFYKVKNGNAKVIKAFNEFYEDFTWETPIEDVRALAEKLGITDRLTIEEKTFNDVDGNARKYVDADRTDLTQIMYFRKENWLLPFFNYEDNCSDKIVHKDDVENFVETAREILQEAEKYEEKRDAFFNRLECDFDYEYDYDKLLTALEELKERKYIPELVKEVYGVNELSDVTETEIDNDIAAVKEIIEAKKSFQEKANRLMPTESGFFFGSTDYNDYYIEDIRNETEQFEETLNTFDWDNDILIMHCWW